MPHKSIHAGTRRSLAEWLLCAGLLLSWGGYLGYSKHLDYDQIASSEQTRLSNQALVIEKNLTSQLLSANRALEGLLIELASEQSNRAGASTFNARLKLISDTLPGVSPILIINPSGKIIHSSVASLLGFDTFGRDYFQTALKQRRHDTLYVSDPFTSALGSTTIPLVREITDAQGEFGGVVLAALDPVFFGVLTLNTP